MRPKNGCRWLANWSRGMCTIAPSSLGEFGDILVEIDRLRAAAGTLVEFRRGGEAALGPSQRHVQRDQFHDRTGKRTGDELRRALTQQHAVSVAQVTDHLVRGHPAPAARAVIPQRVQAVKDFGLVGVARQRFHRVTDLALSARAGARRRLRGTQYARVPVRQRHRRSVAEMPDRRATHRTAASARASATGK